MITATLKTWTGSVWGSDVLPSSMTFLSCDNIIGRAKRSFESVSYPEEGKEHIVPIVVNQPFDFKAKFYVDGGKTVSSVVKRVAKVVDDLNASITDSTGTLPVAKKVKLEISSRNITIVGYALPVHQASDFWYQTANTKDAAVIELTIRVTDPSECSFF